MRGGGRLGPPSISWVSGGEARAAINVSLTPLVDQDSMDPEFIKTMNAIGEGVPKDIKKASDDVTFERKSKDKLKLYK